MTATLREARPADADALVAFDHLAAVEPRREAFVRAAVASGSCVVAELGATLAGFAVLDVSFFGRGFVHLLYVRAELRRRGAGAALLSECQARCRTPKLFTSTNLSNRPMQALLANAGFAVTGFIDNLDEGDPELIYFKRLRSGP